jgi:hypothetical protein
MDSTAYYRGEYGSGSGEGGGVTVAARPGGRHSGRRVLERRREKVVAAD